ncbi:fatty acid synthase [Bemisia tabaci]|uniref:fatty acid synthase n=1 Tax=Bemisia tabaci TaxID=7038 RepID=UPI003B2879D5
MDPITRQCLETSVEAIIDAGVNPKSLDGTNTAVYANYDFTEMEVMFSEFRRDKVLAGIERCLRANRLSFCLNLHGPSCTLAGGWGTFFHLIEKAKEEIQRGYIEAAVVVCANHIMTQGYARSDGCVAVFLQKEEDAFRNWATLMGAEDKFFKIGRKNYMSFDTENAKNVLKSIYTKCQVDPSKVGYLEADGYGVQERDKKEIEVIREVFCKNRSSPLVLGSVKSNVGHLESASAGVSLIKAILALSKSKVPPTINIDSPLPTLTEAPELQVSTDVTPISTSKLDEKLPQLILLSSRTENGIEDVFRRLRTTKATPEFAFLLNNVFRKAMKGHMYRGFTMASPGIPNIPHKTMKVEKHDRPIWYVFSGMGSQWPGMGLLLLHVPVFRAALERCDRVLKPRGIDIFEVLTSKDEAINDNIIHSFVAISSVQIGLTEVLRALKLEPNGVIGHSVGELGCAYADNCLTIEQTILSAYARGKAVMESTLIEGTMAAVGLGYHDIRDSVPKSIDIGCRNSSTSCTISGPAADVEAYVSKLTSKGVFAKNVSASGIAYHSRYLEPAAPLILKYLREKEG